MNSFLDQAGLEYFWAKIVEKIENASVKLPKNLVKYSTVQSISATEILNATTLGGYSASYFAKASDVSDLSGSVTKQGQALATLGPKVTTLETTIPQAVSGKLDKSGGTMTGPLIAKVGSDQTIAQVRNIIVSTEEPTSEDGSDGDIWIRYTE